LTNEEIGAVRVGVQTLAADCVAVSANYNGLALSVDEDVREVANADDVEADRAILESLVAEEFKFTDPRGNVVDRAVVVDVSLSGRIRYDSIGRGGYETTSETFQVHGRDNTAVLISEIKVSGPQRARNRKTGGVARRSRSGATG
jgi:hypothetical protein